MKLRGTEFGHVFDGSGLQGFFGERYWFHKVLAPFGYSLDGMTLVSKTATLLPRKGNMSLTKRFTPRWPLAKCIKMQVEKESVLNAVSLSNPGLCALLATGIWQKLTEPFGISLMSDADTPEKRLNEERAMAYTLLAHKDEFNAPFFLQINKSCPNIKGKEPRKIIGETSSSLEAYSIVDVPLMPKFSVASAPISAVMELNNNDLCDAICVSNTIPYDYLKLGESVWGQERSPLHKLGGGGISGTSILELVLAWTKELRDAGFTKPINGGGGIMTTADIDRYHRVEVDSVFFASVAMLSVALLKPRLPQELIQYGNQLFGGKS